MTNYERWASTPEKVSDLLVQFNLYVRCGRPAVRSFERFAAREENNARLQTNPRGLLIEWLQEECDERQ